MLAGIIDLATQIAEIGRGITMVEKYSMIIVYFGILIFLGYRASKRIKSMRDFVVGGKSLSFWVAAFSAQATGESAWLLLGLTGMGAMLGFSTYWVVVGELFGVSVAWLPGRPWAYGVIEVLYKVTLKRVS